LIVGAAFKAKGSLAHGRKHPCGVENFTDFSIKPKATKARFRQNNAGQSFIGQPAQPGADVSSKILNLKVGTAVE
jgi:hypothetical protein